MAKEDDIKKLMRENDLLTSDSSPDYADLMPDDVPVMTAEEAAANARQTEIGLIDADPLGQLVGHTIDQDLWERQQYEQELQREQNLINQGFGNITQAGQTADALNTAIVGNMVGQGSVLGQEVDYGPYVGDATYDPNSAAWQYGAMQEYTNRAQGGLTAVERAEMEVNRRMQERDLQAQNQAYMRDMQARGVSGSGLEVANMLGAQQSTAERLMLQNMEQEANAQARADRALDSGAALASDIRGQSFGESSFNQGLQSQYQNEQAKFRQDERNRQWGIVTDTSGAAAGAVEDAYRHQVAPTEFWAGVETGWKPGQPTGSATSDAISKVEGAHEAEKAADLLKDDSDGVFSLLGF